VIRLKITSFVFLFIFVEGLFS